MAEPDTKDLDALLDSLNSSAERFQTLWFSFLGLTLYLAIAALATTHRELLLRDPQILPLVNIKVQLLPFYIIAPLLYLVFHFYLLMMLALLARSAAEFDKQLRVSLTIEADRERYRARVENALFLQLLIGMRNERAGFNGRMLAIIGLITVVLAPLATLVLIQMMFLPYHSFGITWFHRGIVAIDVILIIVGWTLFFKYSGSKSPLLPFRARPRLRLAARGLAGLILISLAAWLSGWEGRWAGEPLIGRPDLTSTVNGVVFGLFPDRLKLRDETIVGKEKWEKAREEIASRKGPKETLDEDAFVPTIKLEGRDLQAADLTGADLRGVSLIGAPMRGARLEAARLDGARLRDAQLQGADLAYAQAPEADFESASMKGINLSHAQLEGAQFNTRQIVATQACATGLRPGLHVASGAQLQGADLSSAQLAGVGLYGAHLQGANLRDAQLQGTDLRFTELRGAEFRSAQLQGADLEDAQLQGADLRKADLQGANLACADATGVALTHAFVYRTDISGVVWSYAEIASVDSNPRLGDQGKLSGAPEKWIAAATAYAKNEDKTSIMGRFARLEGDYQENAKSPDWTVLEDRVRAQDETGSNHRLGLASILIAVACDANGAPYVARNLVTKPPFDEARLASLSEQLAPVRDRMQRGAVECPGVEGFTEDDWRALESIKPAEAAPADR